MEIWLAFILCCIVIVRAHGSDWELWGRKIPRLLSYPAIAALNFAASYHLFHDILLGLIFGAVAAWGLSLGHNNVFEMKGAEDDQDFDGCEFISRPLFRHYKWSITKPVYSWVAMGTKGLIVGCATIPTAYGLMLLWPLAYWVCFRLFRFANTPTAEVLAGGFVGLLYGWVLL